ncbi:MAG TPA: protein kinase [Ktedonobacterales bacterium]|jgi:serine/threonine protein kinase
MLLQEQQEAPAAPVASLRDKSSDDRHDAGEDIPPLAAGTLLAPGYSVVDHLRRTRTYDIYDVWSHERHCSCVAKALRADCLDDLDDRRRLRREGRLLQRFCHPHLVRAYEVIEAPHPMMILETLTGDTLEALLDERRRRLPLSDVVYLGLHLCSAVRYLHLHRLLHLDLKPSNIISTCGVAKVLDLSLARPPGRGHRGAGTRIYMAPEQARGDLVSAATDVWGIGAVLFEAASGLRPFAGYDKRMKYPQLERRAVSIRSHRRVPALFAQAVDGCLEPDPARRPAVDELSDMLQRLVL